MNNPTNLARVKEEVEEALFNYSFWCENGETGWTIEEATNKIIALITETAQATEAEVIEKLTDGWRKADLMEDEISNLLSPISPTDLSPYTGQTTQVNSPTETQECTCYCHRNMSTVNSKIKCEHCTSPETTSNVAKAQPTCLSLDCPERHGGKCNAAERIAAETQGVKGSEFETFSTSSQTQGEKKGGGE